MSGDPFQIDDLPAAPLRRAALAAARPLLSALLQLEAYRALYQQTLSAPDDKPFESRALDALDIQPICGPADVASIPTRGPLVMASNHPHGVLDGLLLACVLRSARP